MDATPIPGEETLARRLVAEGVLSERALTEALRDRPDGQPLGVFLVIKGVLTPEQLERLLFPAAERGGGSTHRADLLLADALVERRIVPRDAVEEALQVQKDLPLPLGTLLVRMGSVSATKIREHARDLPPVLPESAEPPAWSSEVVQAVRDPKRRFGKYVLLEEVGRGGMGVVYRAHDVMLDRQVALKMLLTEAFGAGAASTPGTGITTARPTGAGETAVERFLREARAAGRLSHPGIIPVYEVGVHGGVHFFTMEFVEGPSLEKVLRGARLVPRVAARVVQEAAEAVHHSHMAGIIHRDLKPGNVLLSKSPEALVSDDTLATKVVSGPVILRELTGRVRIADFGLARTVTAPGLTSRGDVMGTPAYMSPEQAAGNVTEVDARSDVYSLGALLYHAMTGFPPYLGEGPMQVLAQVLSSDPVPPRKYVPDLAVDLEVIALRAMSKEKGSRYASSQALAEDLGRFLRGEAIHARPIGRVERATRWVRRHRPLAAALLAVVVLAAFGAYVGVRSILDRLALARALVHQSRGVDILAEAGDELRAPDPDMSAVRQEARLAIAAFDEALAECPSLASALRSRADAHLMVGEFAEGMNDLDGVIRLSPGNGQALRDRALLRIAGVLIPSDPLLGVSVPPRVNATKWLVSHAAPPLSSVQQTELARAREDLSRVAALQPDRVKSFGAPCWLLLLDGKPKEALASVDEILSAHPSLPWAWLLRARCLVGLGRTQEALPEVARYHAVYPNNPWAQLLHAFLLLDAGRVDEAVRILRHYVGLFESPIPASDRLAHILIDHGFPEEALTELARDPGNPVRVSCLTQMANAWFVRGRFEKASECLEDAMKSDPRSGVLFLLRGEVRESLKQWEEALADFREARRLGGGNAAQLGFWNASALVGLGRWGEAVDEAQVALKLEPEWPDLWSLSGEAKWGKGDTKDAEADFAKALAIDPLDAKTYILHGRTLKELGRPAEGLKEIDEGIRLEPEDEGAHLARASCLEALQRPEDALTEYGRAIAIAPDDLDARLLRGSLLHRLKRYEDAARDYSFLLEKRPEDVETRWLRAQCLQALEQWEKAAADFARVVEIDPKRKGVRTDLADCLMTLGRWTEARKDLEDGVKEDGSDAEAWIRLGVCAMKLEDRRAIECFRKAESLFPSGKARDKAREYAETAEKRFAR